jgi:hypothetical protein
VRRGLAMLALGVCLAAPALAEPAKAEPRPLAQSTLTDDDLRTLGAVFQQLADAFRKGDVRACMALFAESPQRSAIRAAVTTEFAQVEYQDFKILEVLPDDTLANGDHTVEVHLSCAVKDRNTPGSNTAAAEPEPFTTTQIFAVRKLNNGSFVLVGSDFFKSLGKRTIMGRVVEFSTIMMAACVVLAFWVWMGALAWWRHPRDRFWRVVVLIPLVGALAFFFCSYLPRLFRPEKSAERR